MTSRQTLPRVGVIGLGRIGRTHIDAWQANGVTPLAFADASQAALDTTVAEFGGTGFGDGLDLVASGLVDVVSVCTPPAFHRELVIAALDAGIAVLCEKPMAHTIEDARAIYDAVQRTGTLFTVGFCHRFQPHIERLKALIDNGELGTVMSYRNRFAGLNAGVEATWFANPDIAGGGVLSDTSVHSIDTFRYLIGDPVRAHAFISTRETNLGPALAVEDTAVLTLQTADGTIGVIESSWRTPVGEWSFAIHGSRATAHFDYDTMKLQVHGEGGTVQVVEVEAGDRFQREFAHFIACWRGDADPRVSAADGLAANELLDAAYRTARAS
jgi:predicted dehydrogenase